MCRCLRGFDTLSETVPLNILCPDVMLANRFIAKAFPGPVKREAKGRQFMPHVQSSGALACPKLFRPYESRPARTDPGPVERGNPVGNTISALRLPLSRDCCLPWRR